MDNSKIINFKYRSSYLFNIICFLLFILFLIAIYIIVNNIKAIGLRIIYILLTYLAINIWMLLINNKLCILNGYIKFNKDNFEYNTLGKSYIIEYSEIEYIAKESHIDRNNLFNIEKYIYKIKIKNDGYFVFEYVDDSLIDALNELANISKINIDDSTK
jgi:hypothetical protein